MKRYVAIAACLIGISLVALSWLWPIAFGARHNWTEEQQAEYLQAVAEAHQSSGQAAKDRLDRTTAALRAARNQQAATVSWLKWTGIVFAVGGVAAWLSMRDAD